MSSPKKNREGIPVGLLIVILGTVGVFGLVGIGLWSLSGAVKLSTFPVNGEWQAKGKPWRLVFREDKTLVSSTGPSQQSAAQAWTSEPGTYKVDYYGNLWVMLKNGKTYSASLVPPPGDLSPVSTNRFDLIEFDTQAVTVFEKIASATPKQPDAPKQSRHPDS
ncbi:MAG: hypothetical protein ACLPKT_24295 [Methylocella sp.]